MQPARPWPASPDAISPGWLEEVLSSAGTPARVAGVEVTPILELGGVNGETFRLHAKYEQNTEAPPSVVAKFPSRSASALGVARFQRWYEREVRFYRELAGNTPVRTPRCYAAEIDDGHRFVLLLEDLAPREQGDQIAACGPERAGAAVEAIAALHARWWNDASLAAHDWLPLTTVGLDHARPVQGAVLHGWQAAEASGLLPTSLARHGNAVVAGYPGLLERIARPPLTVVHGDYRLDNLFFGEGAEEVHVIDWQFACRARGAYDAGYFIGLDLEPGERARHEESLLARYVEALRAGGVRDYDLDACREDYRVALLLGLAVFLIGAAREQPNERMQRVHETGIGRLARAIEESGALDVL